MEYSITKHEESLSKIAQIMSERTGCKVTANNVRTDILTVTTAIYSAVIYETIDNVVGVKSIICKVRKWKKPHEYEVTSERIY